MRVFGKVGFVAGIGCAALGLAHLQSGSLRTAAPVAAVAGAPAKAAEPALAGALVLYPAKLPWWTLAVSVCQQSVKRMQTPAGLSDGLFDQR
jgi:hypothetical protein